MSLLLLFGLFALLAFPSSAFAQTAELSDLDQVFSGVISSVIILAGMAFLGMLVKGGFDYLSAGTNRDAAARAQHTLTWAFTGFIVVLSVWIILNIVGRFFGITDFGNFSICIVAGC